MTPEYIEFVNSRVKPGQAILDNLSGDKCHVIHMMIGLYGELLESMEATDHGNEVEEMGDMLFYFTGLTSHYVIYPKVVNVPLFRLRTIAAEVETLNNILKKHVIYNKPLDMEELSKQADIVFSCIMIYTKQCLGTTVEELMANNMDKLTKRYPTKYNDAAALARADKA